MQITGEKFIPVVISTPPPPEVYPGETITFSFSGGYLIPNMAEVCGEGEIVRYVHADELPDCSHQRGIEIFMDETLLTELDCDYNCEVRVSIPPTTSNGTYVLRVAYTELEFEIKVSGSNNSP